MYRITELTKSASKKLRSNLISLVRAEFENAAKSNRPWPELRLR